MAPIHMAWRGDTICFSFIFGFYLLHEFVKGYVSVSRFRFFFSHVFIIMAFGVPYDLYEPTVY